MSEVTWTIRCKLLTCPDTWTVLHTGRTEPILDILKEVEQAVSSPFGAFIVPGTMEVIGSDGQRFQLAGIAQVPSEAIPALLATLQAIVEHPAGPVTYPEDFDINEFRARGGQPGMN